jgi:hypothetical protein
LRDNDGDARFLSPVLHGEVGKAARRYLRQSATSQLLTAKSFAHREQVLLHRRNEERTSHSYAKPKPSKRGRPPGPGKPRRKPNAAA